MSVSVVCVKLNTGQNWSQKYMGIECSHCKARYHTSCVEVENNQMFLCLLSALEREEMTEFVKISCSEC